MGIGRQLRLPNDVNLFTCDRESMEFELRLHYDHIGQNIFKWEGLPEEIPSREPERMLYYNGLCGMFREEISGKYFILPVTLKGCELDQYGLPVEWGFLPVAGSALSEKIMNQKFTEDDSVLIWNNSEHRETYPYIYNCVNAMVGIDESMRLNALFQQLPLWITADTEQNALSIKTMVAKIMNREPFIAVNKNMMEKPPVDVIAPNIPFVGVEMAELYNIYDNRIMQYLGEDYLPVEKQERLITGEIETGQFQTYTVRESKLLYRRKAADRMNELWGLNVTVDYNTPEIEVAEQPEGDNNELQSTEGLQNSDAR